MKRCTVCGALLSAEQFALKNRSSGLRHSYCYPCQRNYTRAHYLKNKDAYNARRYVRQRRVRIEARQRIMEFLQRHPCVDCGEDDIRVLEFDHVRGQKVGNLSKLVGDGIAWQRIEAELAKCEVRCANCHRRKTALQFGWFRIVGGT